MSCYAQCRACTANLLSGPSAHDQCRGGHDSAAPLARLLGTTTQRCARLVSNAIPEVRTLSLPGGRADELAHAVGARQDSTACAGPGAIAIRALYFHYGHHRKRRAESGTSTSAEDCRERTG